MNTRKVRTAEEQGVLNEFYGFEVGDFTAMGKGPIMMAKEIVRLRMELNELHDAVLVSECTNPSCDAPRACDGCGPCDMGETIQ